MMRNLIAGNSDHQFYHFGSGEQNASSNAHAIRFSNHYRILGDAIDYSQVWCPRPALSLHEKNFDIAMMLDMAEGVAATGLHFDVLELPDFDPLIGLFPYILRTCGVQVGKVVLALHGTLTSAIEHLWHGPHPSDLQTLRAYEQLTYLAVDCRYGISKTYLRERADKEGIMGHMIDPLQAVDMETVSWGEDYVRDAERSGVNPKPTRPDLNFVGRQDFVKGADIFLCLASNLPPKSYGAINLYGHGVASPNGSSHDVLRRIASLRGLSINDNGPLPRKQLHDVYASGRGITFTTSRYDTFNLSALESLLNGCPTVISECCGVSEYLDRVWPGLPYVKVKADDIWPVMPDLMDLVGRYDYWREQITRRLADRPREPDTDSRSLYQWPGRFRDDARDELALIAEGILKVVETFGRRDYFPRKVDEVVGDAVSHSMGHASTDNKGQLRDIMYGVEALRQLHFEPNGAALRIDRLDKTVRTLKEVAQNRRAERIAAFGLMAEAELRRGNDILYPVYQSRRFRLSRRVDPRALERSIEILNAHDMPEDANALGLLHRGNPDQVYEYLKAQTSRCVAPSAEGIEFIEHFNRRENPRVAVLVSIYRSESKVAQFIQGMRSFIPETLQSLEVIFVDSGSPDQTSVALRRELSRPTSSDQALDATLMRTTNRETIQAAWNRALTVARAPYITFLGADEMMRPDSLKVLSEILDRRGDIDWVQGNGVVCEVNDNGTPIKDVMVYNRQMSHNFMNYLECCYIGWVGALYRRKVHDRVGFYDPTFRAAGDNEFKNRALPQMRVMSIPEMLGTFRNFPEERMTQSPVAEIEDIRAWHLPRSIGGMRYAFEGRDPAEAVLLFNTCLSYRKSYMDMNCTDIDLAQSVAGYLELYEPSCFNEVQRLIPQVVKTANAYRQLDGVLNFRLTTPVGTLSRADAVVKEMALQLAQAEREIRELVPGCSLGIVNDNRYHQYQNIWPSRSKRFGVEIALSPADMAGPQDLAELLSSCQSSDPAVDFELAWTTNRLHQLRKLFEEKSLDLVVPVTNDLRPASIRSIVAELMPRLVGPNSMSLLLAGPANLDSLPAAARIYVLGEASTMRPVLAASRLNALPYWATEDVDACLSLAVSLLGSAKPLLVSDAIYKQLTLVLGDLSPAVGAGHLLVCPTQDSLAEQVAAFVSLASEARAGIGAAAWHFARGLHAHFPAIQASPDAPSMNEEPAFALPLEWGPPIERLNRAIHALVEQEDQAELRDLFNNAGRDARVLATYQAMIEALFVSRRAPALATRQAIFVTIGNMATRVVADYLTAPADPASRVTVRRRKRQAA